MDKADLLALAQIKTDAQAALVRQAETRKKQTARGEVADAVGFVKFRAGHLLLALDQLPSGDESLTGQIIDAQRKGCSAVPMLDVRSPAEHVLIILEAFDKQQAAEPRAKPQRVPPGASEPEAA